MTSPNSTYSDVSLYDGIPVTSGDFIKIFCDEERVIKIRRSIAKMVIDSNVLYYTLSDTNLILKINGTAVRIRLTKLDLSKAYLFDLKTDNYLGVASKTIPVFGDKKSMSPDDLKGIYINSKRIKAIDNECKKRKTEADFPDEPEDLPIFDPSIKFLIK